MSSLSCLACSRRVRAMGIAVVLTAACLLGWQTFRGWPVSADSGDLANAEWLIVKRGAFHSICIEDGELKPVKVTTVGFTIWGKVSWMVPEGTRVNKDDRLITLETEDLDKEIQQVQDEVAVSEKNFAQKEQTRDLERKRLETELLAEHDRLDLAKLKTEETLTKPTALEKEEAANILKGAEARVAAAQADFEALQPLLEKEYANRAEVEAKDLALKLGRNELERAKLKADKLRAGTTAEERQRAVLDRTMAEATYKLKLIDKEKTARDLDFEVRQAKHHLERLQERLKNRQSQREECTRLAPHDGIVIYRSIGWETAKKVAIGDQVGPWAQPIDLPSYEVMKVRTQVPESVVRSLVARRHGSGGENDLHNGSAARVRVKTLSGKVYPAEVTWIDGWARDRHERLSEAEIKNKGLAGVRVFDVEVELKESDPDRLRDGFQASVEFPIETLNDVLTVPVHAVSPVNGRPSVKVSVDGRLATHPVKLGQESNGQVVVLEGLQEGDRVLIPPKSDESESEQHAPRPQGSGDAKSREPTAASKPGPGSTRTGTQGGGQSSGHPRTGGRGDSKGPGRRGGR